MKKPLIPANEGQRLATLRALNLLDTPPEPRFDRITRLAGRLFGVPIALVTLVDADRQWFKSAQGLCLGEMPRDISFCGHAILSPDGLVVPDTLLDERFADNPLVLGETNIRFYAGQPLRAADGSQVGVLCLKDHRPRSWSAEDRKLLRDLADLVEDQLHLIQSSELQREMQERQRAEEERRASDERLRIVTWMTNDAVWDWDLTTNKVWWNEGVRTLFGYHLDPQEADPAWWLERLHPEDREAVAAYFFQVVRGQDLSWVDEYRFRCADGTYKDVYDRGYVLRDAAGRAVRMIGAMLDISPRKRAEEALRQAHHDLEMKVAERTAELRRTTTEALAAQQRFQDLVNSVEGIVWEADAQTFEFSFVSAQAERILGYPVERWLREPAFWKDHLHPEDRDWAVRFCQEATAQMRSHQLEYRMIAADGRVVWLRDLVAVVVEEGRATHLRGVMFDVTERRAKEAAEAANRAKDEFLANVSHEIRTPMNAILGMTELALDTPLTEDQRLCLRTVRSAADNLLGIINDLLDFSKIEAGKLELAPADFSLRAAVGDTVRALAVRAHTKGLELVVHVQPDVPDSLIGDAGRLRQVLLNLVGNALKFTDRGEVEVRVEEAHAKPPRRQENQEERKEEQPEIEKVQKPPGSISGSLDSSSLGALASLREIYLHFKVRDTGIGIPKDQQERIFRAFEQEDASTTRRYGGTGLGLTIASRLVALMGGTITVDSAPGRGSTFAFTARFGRQPHSPESVSVPLPVPLQNLPVLVVDDNATNRHLLEEWLSSWQMQAESAGDGLAALNALGRAARLGRPYALVLLDARMPDTGGLALAARIREQPELSATRLLLLTSGDHPSDRARSRELRIDAHLLKPVQQDELLETISRVLGGGWRGAGKKPAPDSSSPALHHPPPAARHPLHLLVAEDNEFNAQLLEQLLRRRGHRVRLATNGREALSLATEGVFDLLLLDLHMPELDGFQVARAVRAKERTAGGHLPMIALTARARKEDRERCLAAGMDDFLAKPIQVAELWAAIDQVVGVRLLTDPPRTDLLDPPVLLAACGGEAAILERICQTFRARLPEQLKAVQDALGERDALQLREAAHKLAGMMAVFSTAAGGVASDLEDQAAQGLLDEAPSLVARLETMAEELLRQAGGLSLDALYGQAGTVDR
ncbi:MAG: response regulator [Planctomycetes bacterium]|nr:response regulator [Planctomycetota bacterium]